MYDELRALMTAHQVVTGALGECFSRPTGLAQQHAAKLALRDPEYRKAMRTALAVELWPTSVETERGGVNELIAAVNERIAQDKADAEKAEAIKLAAKGPKSIREYMDETESMERVAVQTATLLGIVQSA